MLCRGFDSCGYVDILIQFYSPNRSACMFSGFSAERLFVGKDQNNYHVVDALNRGPSSAMIVTANALQYINSHEVLSTLQEIHKASKPVLILGVTPATDFRLLKNWS